MTEEESEEIMKTIKIIDLLNKIANGEEVPEKIKYDEMIFEYQGSDWLCKKNGWWFITSDDKILENLNDEVEILDEEDEFEDIEEIGGFHIYGNDYTPAICEISNKVDKLIKNQKKIIERLQNENSKNNV